MSELRACDYTLDSFAREAADSRVVCSDDTSVRGGMVAHLPAATLPVRHPVDRVQLTYCGLYQNLGFRVQQARHARWFAVPCPRCFPDAPEPGTDPFNRPRSGMYLRWQTDGQTRE